MPATYILAEDNNSPLAYEPRGAARELWICKDHQVMIEGPSETGKTLACLHKLDALSWKYPGMQGLIVRKSYASLVGSVVQSYIKRVLGQTAGAARRSDVAIYGGSRPEEFRYPNGSVVWLGGMDNPDKVLSQERDIIYVNQAEELNLTEWEILTTRCTGRAGNVPNPQIIGDCNPGHPTHWILDKSRKGALTLLHSKHVDNPTLWDAERQCWTEQGERTMNILSKLTGSRKQRLLDGLWVVPEGAIYEIFSEERHVVKSFAVPNHWPRVIGIDPRGAYIAALWGAYDPANNRLHIYREYLQPFGLTTAKNAQNILDLSKGETIWRWFGGGPSERQERLDFTIALGFELESPPAVGVWPGIDRVTQLLGDGGLVIHEECTGLRSEIGGYSRVVNAAGDVTDTIKDKDTFHLLDSLRYLVVGLLGEPQQEVQEIRYLPTTIGVNY